MPHRRNAEKTAEERFHTLARGWLAYPVISMHSHLPPKSGCINVITRFALSRRRATALFRNPVCKAQRSVPGFSSTPTSACQRYATSPPSPIGLPQRRNTPPCENRRRAVVENTPEGGIVRHRTLRSVFLNEAASPQPILAYLSNIVLPTYHQ